MSKFTLVIAKFSGLTSVVLNMTTEDSDLVVNTAKSLCSEVGADLWYADLSWEDTVWLTEAELAPELV